MQQAVDGFSVSFLFKHQYASPETVVKFEEKYEILLAAALQIISSKNLDMYAVVGAICRQLIYLNLFIINFIDSEQRHWHDRPCSI